jgi:TonB family protein
LLELPRDARISRMPTPLLARPLALIALLGLLVPAVARAQSSLYVEHEHQMKLVRSARGDRPCVDLDGKLTSIASHRYALQTADDYLPLFVSIRQLRVETVSDQSIDDSSETNSTFQFSAEFASAYTLGDVFVVLEFKQPSGVQSFFLREIGDLAPNQPKWRHFGVLLDHALTDHQYTLHLFVGGAEVLHSEMSPEYREQVLARMVAQRLAHRPDGPPAPFIGPPPVYPAKLAAAKTQGRAVVRIHILATGAVADPALVSATDPAFGDAALESMRQWRFLPRLKDGHAVDTVVNMPVDFAPPVASEKS